MKIHPKMAMSITCLITFPITMITLIAPLLITEKFYPATAIGTIGLENVKKYCLVFTLSYLISTLLIPVLFWIFSVIYRIISHDELCSRMISIFLSVIFMIIYITSFPRASKFELQSEKNGYPKSPLVQTVMLYLDINKDLRSDESFTAERNTIDLKGTIFQYRTQVPRSTYGSRTSIISSDEYGIYDHTGTLLGQISRKDFYTLSEGMFTYIPHSVEVFPHSGLIKSIDSKEMINTHPMKIELTFDDEAGILRRELLCEDEDLLPEMQLRTTMNGNYTGGGRINGETEIRFKPMIPGHAEAWIVLLVENQYPIVISNVIACDQTEYVQD